MRHRRTPSTPALVIIACGALARELRAIIETNALDRVKVACLPAKLHNRPQLIPEAVRGKIHALRPLGAPILCAYGDCGTGGLLDAVLAEEGVERLPGAHCYAFYAGLDAFDALHDEEPGTFYLTDFLVRHFRRLLVEGLGLDRHPELFDDYFRHYRRVIWLAQAPTDGLGKEAEAAARFLRLPLAIRDTGFGLLGAEILRRVWRKTVASLTILYWRDVPTQIVARAGRATAKAELPPRFMTAVDAAAMHAGLTGSDDYLSHWRRGEPTPCGDDLDAAVAEAVAALDKAYDPARLRRLVEAGGTEAA